MNLRASFCQGKACLTIPAARDAATGPALADKSFANCLKRVIAFTLVELLVVISIISVMATLLLPALSGAKKKANGVVCSSNLKQLAPAIFMYANDHADLLVDYKSASPPYSWDWKIKLSPYVEKELTSAKKGSAVWKCPYYNYDHGVGDFYRLIYPQGQCYAINGAPGMAYYGKDEPVKLVRAQAPSMAALIADTGGYESFYRYCVPRFSDYPIYAYNGPGWAHYWGTPNVGFNSLFLDGHVKYMRYDPVVATAVYKFPFNGWQWIYPEIFYYYGK